jgi:murein DD-endopeptidase MepM/ murein hydrolase activator NlpD
MTALFFRTLLLASVSILPVPVLPVSGTVVEGFRPPACLRCAGHRGVTFATALGSPVVVVRSGVVTFAGEVAHRTYVVVEIASHVLVTYGWLTPVVGLQKGVAVQQGALLGAAGEQFYFGVRVAGAYVDPLRYLGLTGARLRGSGNVVVGQRPFAR